MTKTAQNITIVGGGAWGKALKELAERNNHEVKIWSRKGSENLADQVSNSDVIISAVSMAGVRPVVEQLGHLKLPPNTILVSATKGLDSLTNCTPSTLWKQAFPNHPLVVLSGPNLSKEIRQNLPAATVVSSIDSAASERVQTLFSSERFRVYINTDPIGTELGGTLKNIIAIAAGVSDGLALGTNAKSSLLTRALPEIIRIGKALGAEVETFFGLSGLGDLLTTCSSPLSRNYQVGYRLAKEETLDEILKTLEGTSEGINTAKVVYHIAQEKQLSVPITEQVYHLLNNKTTPKVALNALMERSLKAEIIEF
ncbi:MAG: NAD(P)H-dependent glycerol-3-phosphate dehydrogenase [Microcystaceae cyanobacterium]